jgi:hypothetical protein
VLVVLVHHDELWEAAGAGESRLVSFSSVTDLACRSFRGRSYILDRTNAGLLRDRSKCYSTYASFLFCNDTLC